MNAFELMPDILLGDNKENFDPMAMKYTRRVSNKNQRTPFSDITKIVKK